MSSSSSSSESEFEEQGHWETCKADKDYEIFSEYPYQIRKKSNKRIVKEHINDKGYVCCNLNGKPCKKHRIISLQFISN